MNLLVSGTTENRILMIEMDGKEIKTEVFEESVFKAFGAIDSLLSSIDSLKEQAGKPKAAVSLVLKDFHFKFSNFQEIIATFMLSENSPVFTVKVLKS